MQILFDFYNKFTKIFMKFVRGFSENKGKNLIFFPHAYAKNAKVCCRKTCKKLAENFSLLMTLSTISYPNRLFF